MNYSTLSNAQLEMAWSIAQYDVQAAYRYCVVIDSKNQMKCPFCGQGFSGSYDLRDGSMALVCPCTKRKNRVCFNARIPAPAENCLEIKLNPVQYYSVCRGQPICINTEIAKHQAEKFKVINKATGSYIVRTLVVLGLGNRGYWI